MDAVDALPVESVLESHAECSDADRARAALSEALIAARAPARGGSRLRGARPTSSTAHWTVSMSVAPGRVSATSATPVSATPTSPKSVEALILDDVGNIVAQRTLTDRSARTCVPLARAVGAWASLVLDAELTRAKDDVAQAAPPLPVLAATPSPKLGLVDARPARDSGSSSSTEESGAAGRRSVELGVMTYLRNGMTSTGGFAGVSPFITIEVSSGWVLRPSLAFGRATSGIPVSTTETAMMTHVGARADFCRRIPGNYIERRGIEADLCAGLESSIITPEGRTVTPGGYREVGSAVRVGMGPSANLRGELAAGLALEVRGLLGANFVNAPLWSEASTPLVFASAEIGISLRLP